MKFLLRRPPVLSAPVFLKIDSLLVPLLVIAALTLAGMVFDYATTH